MEYTDNLNLKMPEASDPADIGDINDNMETLDTVVGALQAKIVYLPGDDPPAGAVEGTIWLKPIAEESAGE